MVSTDTLTKNPLLQQEELPKFSSFEQSDPEVERIQFPLGYVWGVAGHLNGVKNGEELRAAYEENQPKVVQGMTKFSQSKLLYDALSKLQKELSAANGELSFAQMQKARAVENSLLEMMLGGVRLEGEEKS
jgi:oligopeptidase A